MHLHTLKAIYCDLLINTSVAELTDLPLVNATNKLLGLKWSLLRKEFRQNNCLLSRTLKRAMICFGGADTLNLTQRAINAITNINGVECIDVVIGEGKKEKDYIFNSRNVPLQKPCEAFTPTLWCLIKHAIKKMFKKIFNIGK